jgi:hypothetical protein
MKDDGMSLSTARVRYLSAMSAFLPALGLAACKQATPPPTSTDGAGTTSTPSVIATATATATATPPVEEPGSFVPMGRCPSGTFCVHESAKVAARAPAPFAKCGATAVHPEDMEDSGVEYRTARSVSFSSTDTATERKKDPAACCYTWVIPCPGGRAFRDATGTPRVADTVARTDWTASIAALSTAQLDDEERARLAEHWTREAAFEHASIASFAQLTLDLLSVGAPPELLEATQRAALDEIEHARITFALATSYGARAVGPAALAALPGASRTLAALARSTFVDACVGESVASAALAEASRTATDSVLGELLATMSGDEERHAELAWRIVAWALCTGGEEVASVLTEAKDQIADELASLAHEVTASPSSALRAMVLREVVLPCTAAMLASSAQASGLTSLPSRRADA